MFYRYREKKKKNFKVECTIPQNENHVVDSLNWSIYNKTKECLESWEIIVNQITNNFFNKER